MLKIEEVAQLAKKHHLHSGVVKWPDEELENLYHFAQELLNLRAKNEKVIENNQTVTKS